MKKTIATLISVAALASFAEPVQIATARIANAEGITSAATKLGMMSGSPLLSAMASAKINDLGMFKYFGKARQGASIAIPIFADCEKASAGKATLQDDFAFAVLYPIDGKDAFLAAHPGNVASNGMTFVETPDAGELSKLFLAFSPDGKWVSASKCSKLAAQSLSLTDRASKSIKGCVARLEVGKDEMANLTASLDKASASALDLGAKPNVEKNLKVLKMYTNLAVALRIADAGIEVEGEFAAAEGTEAAKSGLKALAPNALAGVDTNAIWAAAYAADCGMGQARGQINAFMSLCTKYGLKLDWLGFKSTPNSLSFEIDIPALINYIENEALASIMTLDKDGFANELNAITDASEYTSKNEPFTVSLSIKGFKPKHTPAEILAKTMPEAAGKPVYNANSSTVYSFAKAVLTQIAAVRPELTEGLAPVLAAVPEDGESGTASITWREGNAHHSLFRISAEDIGKFGAAANAITAQIMMNAMKNSAQEAAVPDEDDDADNDD